MRYSIWRVTLDGRHFIMGKTNTLWRAQEEVDGGDNRYVLDEDTRNVVYKSLRSTY